MTTSRRDFLRASACTLGGLALASTVESLGLVGAYAQSATDYRALVCAFLNGGNDGTNLVVPLDDASFNAYDAVRIGLNNSIGLGIPRASLVPVNPPSQGRQFGLHPNLAPEVANPSMANKGLLDVWNAGRLAVVCNVGPLVEPLTRTTYLNGTGKRPLQLFSHSHQINLWQSAIANSVSRTGWGGRLADRSASLNGSFPLPRVVTLARLRTVRHHRRHQPLRDGRDGAPARPRRLALDARRGAPPDDDGQLLGQLRHGRADPPRRLRRPARARRRQDID